MQRLDWSQRRDHITPVLTTLHWLPVRKSDVQDCGVGVEVSWWHCPGSPNSAAFLLPLLQVVSISCQPRRTYCKFLELEPRSVRGASLSWDLHCGTVFLLFHGNVRWRCIPSSDSWRAIRSTSDKLTKRRVIDHRPALYVAFLVIAAAIRRRV